MEGRDVRAVENPITAIFDLADDVTERLPRIRQVVRYTRIFVGFWLFVDFLLLIVLPGGGLGSLGTLLLLLGVTPLFMARRWTASAAVRGIVTAFAVVLGLLLGLLLALAAFPFGPVFLGLYVLGLVILELLADLRRFLDYYALRHRVIQSVRAEDPVVAVPPGGDVVQRLLSYLAVRNPQVRALAGRPGSLQAPAMLRGASGAVYPFEAYVGAPSSSLWQLLGSGAPGYSLFVRAFPRAPTQQDLELLKRSAEDVCAATKAPPSRVIAVWRAGANESLDPAAYGYVTSQVVTFAHRGTTYRCSLEVITESPDGTYDFIPVISDGAYGQAA